MAEVKPDDDPLADTAMSDAGPAAPHALGATVASVAAVGSVVESASASMLASSNTALPSPDRSVPAQPDVLPEVPASAYIMYDEFARGGLGRIIRAKDVRSGRTVAIKEMLVGTPDAAARFVREALVTANLQHPAIVPVYEVGRWPSGQPFYAMKLVVGRPLDRVIAECATFDARLALLPHVIAVADALAYAHGERVIHRDLKPHNVLCGAHGETVVIDWGLARRLDERDANLPPPRAHSAPPGATYVGAVMGTPGFMPPEQAWGDRVNERADVYAIGAILYHLLSGSPPFSGRTLDDVLDRVRSAPPRPLREVEPRVPADLATIVERAMARDPNERYPSAAEIAGDLKRFSEGRLVLAHQYTPGQLLRRFVARNRGILSIAAIGLVTLAVVGIVSFRNTVAAKDEAQQQRARADASSAQARDRLVASYVDRARAELAAERPELALAFALAAAKALPAGSALDDEIRFVAARSLDRLPEMRRHAVSSIGTVEFAPESDDLLIADERGVTRWSPDEDRERWRVETAAGDLVHLAGNRVAAGRVDIAIIDSSTGAVEKVLAPSAGEMLGFIGRDRAGKWLAAPTAQVVDLFSVETLARVATIPIPGVDASPLVSPDGMKVLLTVPTKSSFIAELVIADREGRRTKLCTNCVKRAYAGNELVVAAVPETGHPPWVAFVNWDGQVRLELAPSSNASVIDLGVDETRGLLAIAQQDGSVEVRALSDGALRWRRVHRDRAFQVTFDGKGRLWVLGGFDDTVVYDAASGVELGRWTGGGGVSLAINSRLDRLAVLQPDSVATWPVDDSRVRVLAPSSARVRRVVFLRDGAVATASDDGLIALYDPATGMRELGRHGGRVTELYETASGALLSAGREGTIVLRDRSGRRAFALAAGPRAAVASDGMIATGESDGAVKLWNADGSANRTLGRMATEPMSVRWSDDGARVAAVDEHAGGTVWDRAGTVVRSIPASRGGIDVKFSPDGRWLIRASQGQKTLHALDGGADRALAPHRNSSEQSYASAFTQDGKRVLVVGSGFATLWDVATGAIVTSVSTRTDLVAGAMWLDDRVIVAGGLDRRIRFWDVSTGAEILGVNAPDDVYQLVVDRSHTRIGASTLGAALELRLDLFAGTLAELEATTACRIEVEVVDGAPRRRAIDLARCNQLAASQRNAAPPSGRAMP